MNFYTLLVTLFTLSMTAPSFAQNQGDLLKIYRERQELSTPQSVLQFLTEGNERFSQGRAVHGGYPVNAEERRKIAAQGQRPLAVVLSCIDSRTTPEIIFDTTIGDLFTARVGANVINQDILGSLEISVASGVKVVMVLGHTDCGGIKGACRGLQFGHMTQLFERIKPVIADTNAHLDQHPNLSREIGERDASNPKYIAHVSHNNAKRSVEKIYQASPYLREMVDKGEILLVSALYDVNSGKVLIQ